MFLNGSIEFDDRNIHSLLDGSFIDASERHASNELVVCQIDRLHAQWLVCLRRCLRNGFKNQIKQWLQVFWFITYFLERESVTCICIDMLKVELLVCCAKFYKEIKDHVEHDVWTCGWFVDFVEYDDWLESKFKRFSKYEFCLWHWSFVGVYKKKDGIYHSQNTFNLGTKIRVAWCVHDVDFCLTKLNGGVFGVDGNSTFTFLVIAVHDAFNNLFTVCKGVGLLKHGVHKRGLTVVNVGNDGDVSKIHNISIRNRTLQSDDSSREFYCKNGVLSIHYPIFSPTKRTSVLISSLWVSPCSSRRVGVKRSSVSVWMYVFEKNALYNPNFFSR